jgi:DNA-binding NarL/FixJ family response regulator
MYRSAPSGTIIVIVSAFSDSPFDELYFVAIGGDHLDWSFADQPPLVPLLAAAMHAIAPGSALVLRLLAALAAGAAVIAGAHLAREFGGTRREFARGTAPPNEPQADALTERERETLLLVARGLSTVEIAAELSISASTVKTHIAHLLAKLELRDRVQAVVYAYEHGMVRPTA